MRAWGKACVEVAFVVKGGGKPINKGKGWGKKNYCRSALREPNPRIGQKLKEKERKIEEKGLKGKSEGGGYHQVTMGKRHCLLTVYCWEAFSGIKRDTSKRKKGRGT